MTVDFTDYIYQGRSTRGFLYFILGFPLSKLSEREIRYSSLSGLPPSICRDVNSVTLLVLPLIIHCLFSLMLLNTILYNLKKKEIVT